MNRDMDEKEWSERIAGLPREVAPGRDPWPEISARIGSGAAQPARPRWPWAVAAMLTLALAGLLSLGPRDVVTAPVVATIEPVAAGSAVLSGMPVVVEASEVEYQAAFREFIPVGQARETLPLQAVERIEAGWADLRSAEQALQLALADNPQDPFLNERMLELRARQLGFLRQLAALEQDYRRQTI